MKSIVFYFSQTHFPAPNTSPVFFGSAVIGWVRVEVVKGDPVDVMDTAKPRTNETVLNAVEMKGKQ